MSWLERDGRRLRQGETIRDVGDTQAARPLPLCLWLCARPRCGLAASVAPSRLRDPPRLVPRPSALSLSGRRAARGLARKCQVGLRRGSVRLILAGPIREGPHSNSPGSNIRASRRATPQGRYVRPMPASRTPAPITHVPSIAGMRVRAMHPPATCRIGSTSTAIFPLRTRNGCCAAIPASTGSPLRNSSGWFSSCIR